MKKLKNNVSSSFCFFKLFNLQMAERYVKDAKCLIGTGEQNDVISALNLLDAALALSPVSEQALELKARCLLYLRRYKEVADMLQDYIPSVKMASADESGSENSSQQLSREQTKLLSSSGDREPSFKCFSVAELRKKIVAGFCKSCEKQSQWRYIVLGQASCHLGLLEDGMVLLQTGKRLATAALRRESTRWSDDGFSFPDFPILNQTSTPPPTITESETVATLLSHVKLLIRRRTAALAALDAGLYSEAIRHFTKIVDGRRSAPQGFLAECYMHRSSAYQAVGRITDSISDCNRTLALDPTCIQALETRSLLFETIRCLPDCLHDLEHLKLLYNSILRDRKLPGPAWKRHNIRYREIPGKLCALTAKIQRLKQTVVSGEVCNVDYYGLIGLRRGCSRSELERAHLLLCLRHKPDKATGFLDRCELADDSGLDSIRERAKMTALLLYRLLQKGYSSIMATVMEEEKQRKRAAAAAVQVQQQGVFCREMAVVGNLLSQVAFGRPIPVKYEALSC